MNKSLRTGDGGGLLFIFTVGFSFLDRFVYSRFAYGG